MECKYDDTRLHTRCGDRTRASCDSRACSHEKASRPCRRLTASLGHHCHLLVVHACRCCCIMRMHGCVIMRMALHALLRCDHLMTKSSISDDEHLTVTVQSMSLITRPCMHACTHVHDEEVNSSSSVISDDQVDLSHCRCASRPSTSK